MTPAAAAARLNRMADRLGRGAAVAAEKSANQGNLIARDLSKGPYSLLTLARMGHPYAQRHAATARALGMTRKQYALQAWGGTIANDYIINKQSGRFLSAWRTEPPRSSFSGSISAFVVNDSPEAKFLKYGTSRMIRRPIGPKVADLLRPIAVDNVREAVRRALKSK